MIRRCLAAAVMAVCADQVTAVAAAAPPTAAAVEGLAWLQGCWRLTTGTRVVEEQWTAPQAGAMLGMGRTVVNGRLTEYEFVVIRERAGALVYEAHPSGQPAAEFTATSVDEMSLLFENPQHDFPQRIGYRRMGARLDAWIEGTTNGRSRRVEFPYERVACAGD